jgi:hypothetical protein
MVGLTGAMYVQAEGLAECPRTAAGWRDAAPRLRLTSGPSPFVYSPLEVYPPMLQAGVFGLPLNFSNLAVNLTLGPGQAEAGGGRGAAAGVPMRVAADIVDGYSFSNTSFTGGAKLDSMRGQSYTGSSVAQFRVREQQRARGAAGAPRSSAARRTQPRPTRAVSLNAGRGTGGTGGGQGTRSQASRGRGRVPGELWVAPPCAA